MRRLLHIFALLGCCGCCGLASAQAISNGASISNGARMLPPVGLCVILTNSLPPGTPGVLFDQTISVTADCQTPFVYSVFTGVFPPWATLNPSTGEISGIAAPGTYNFVLRLQDGTGSAFFSQALTITTPNGGGGGGGGGPLLPSDTVMLWDTTQASNPSTGPIWCVEHAQFANPAAVICDLDFNTGFPGNISGDLAGALTDPVCGTRIYIANLIYNGSAQLDEIVNATQNCAGNWISIERDPTDTNFPAEGQRVDPSYAGLPQTAFPNLPYPTANTNPNNTVRHMPKIITPASSNLAPFHFRIPNASNSGINAPSYIRIKGLEFARDGSADILTVGGIDLSYAPANPGQDCAVTLNGSGNVDKNSLPVNAVACMNVQPHDIILQQLYIHGDAQRQTTRGINFAGARKVAFLDSWGSDIQLTTAGGGGDAQFYFAGGGHGFTNVGLYKILNNETSSSSEGSIFCGAFTEAQSPATGFDGVPHDIWFGGGNFIIKNPLWNPMLGQTMSGATPPETSQTIDGVTYPAAPDTQFVLNPSSVTLAVNQVYPLNSIWLNDTFGGFNRIAAAVGSVSVCDSLGNNCVTNGNSTIGTITRTVEHAVGSGAWISNNQVTYTYTAPASIGTHVITAIVSTHDSRFASLGNSNRTLTASMTVTVVASNPTKSLIVTPNASTLRMPPSYPSGTLGATDSAGNSRQFCYELYAIGNYTLGTLQLKVDGTVGGTSQIGTATTPTGMSTSATTQEFVYCSADAAHQANHSITVTDTTNTITSPASVISVSATAPILGYDQKPQNVKNAFECKCAEKLLVENNYFENCWGSDGTGGGQTCPAVLLQTVNQANQLNDGNGVTVGYGPGHVGNGTFRNNYWQHMGAGFIFVALNSALGMHNIAFTGNVCDDCNYQRNGNGFLNIVEAIQSGGTASKPVLSWTSFANPLACNVSFTHNTVIGLFTNTFSLQNYIAQFPLCGFKFQDNIIASGGLAANATIINANGEDNDANQGPAEDRALQGAGWNPIPFSSCKTPNASHTWYCNVASVGWEISVAGAAYTSTPTPPGSSLFSPSYIFDHNELMDSTESAAHFNCGGGGCDSSHPLWQLDHTAAKFVNYNNALNGDYRLCTIALCGSNSPFAAAQADQASDGTDLGAPVATDQAVRTNALAGTRTP
jgi:hypothetical protein